MGRATPAWRRSTCVKAKPGEVLIEVAAVGICGSDLHYYKDGGIGGAVVRDAVRAGHEFGGYLCDDVAALGLSARRVGGGGPQHRLRPCEWCREGYFNLCPNVEFFGARRSTGR